MEGCEENERLLFGLFERLLIKRRRSEERRKEQTGNEGAIDNRERQVVGGFCGE